jgi:hypothetical protein
MQELPASAADMSPSLARLPDVDQVLAPAGVRCLQAPCHQLPPSSAYAAVQPST